VIFPLFISLVARFPYVGSGVTRNYVQIFQLTSGANEKSGKTSVRCHILTLAMLAMIVNMNLPQYERINKQKVPVTRLPTALTAFTQAL